MDASLARDVPATAPGSDTGVTQTSGQRTSIPGLGGAVSDMRLERGLGDNAVIAADGLSLGHDGIGLDPLDVDQGSDLQDQYALIRFYGRATQQAAHSWLRGVFVWTG